MRLRTPLLTFAAFALAAGAAARAQEPQQKDEKVIEDFITTRGVSFDGPDKKPQKKPAPPPRRSSTAGKSPSGGVASSKGGAAKGTAAGKSNKPAARPGAGAATEQAGGAAADAAGAQVVNAGSIAQGALALGHTVLLKDGAGRLSVVDAAREFKTGDNIAVALEANADGYLYMFNAPDAKNPELLFPNVQLDGGANSLQAHVRATFPADPSYDFRFTDPPAREHLFVVLSREPLPGVPTGDALAEFCAGKTDDCAWRPPAALWERIRRAASGRGVTEAKNAQLAQAQPYAPQMLQRGLKVKREDPGPAVVRVNHSPDADILVTEIVLAHK